MTDLIKKIFGTDRGSALEHGNFIGFLNKSGADASTTVQAIVKGVEASSPIAEAALKVIETLEGKPPTSPIAVISDIGAIVTIFDPTIVTDFTGKVNAFLEGAGLQAEEEKVDALVVSLFAALGITAPASATTPTA